MESTRVGATGIWHFQRHLKPATMMLASASRRSALVVASKRSQACLSTTIRSMSTQEQKDQDNILPVSFFLVDIIKGYHSFSVSAFYLHFTLLNAAKHAVNQGI